MLLLDLKLEFYYFNFLIQNQKNNIVLNNDGLIKSCNLKSTHLVDLKIAYSDSYFTFFFEQPELELINLANRQH